MAEKPEKQFYDEKGNFVLDGDREKSMYSPICCQCKHLTSITRHRCKAFTDRIPDIIWDGQNDHTEPVPGDNGIQFKPR